MYLLNIGMIWDIYINIDDCLDIDDIYGDYDKW